MSPRRVASRETQPEIPLRIIVAEPPSGVAFQLQRGSKDLEPPVRRRTTEITFEFPVRIGRRAGGAPNFLGPYTQGPPAQRFVYINSGALAGQADSRWSRRAKVPLTAITWSQIERASKTGKPIEAVITGTGRDGGPCCASVPVLDGWRIEFP